MARKTAVRTDDLAYNNLVEANRILREENKQLVADNALLNAKDGGKALLEAAKIEATKHEEFHKGYMQGLTQGLSMAGVRTAPPPSAFGAVGSSSMHSA